MLLHSRSKFEIQNEVLPGPSAVVCMADSEAQLAVVKDAANVLTRLDLVFNDATEPFHLVSPPSDEHCRRLIEFVKIQDAQKVPNLVFQCEVGVGRSRAALAAIGKIYGRDIKPIFRQGTYNRRLYRGILLAARWKPDPEPLVSIAVRVKYAPDRLHLFLLSMRRQRYENWEVVAVTDGPDEEAARLVDSFGDSRIRLIQTAKPLGRWGHPYRQIGLDACRGEFIGMSNDDNYYVPGFLDQMIVAIEDADLALCRCLHSYYGWNVLVEGQDLGAWIARATLVRGIPWSGLEFSSDKDYIAALKAAAGDRVAKVEAPLFVHN